MKYQNNGDVFLRSVYGVSAGTNSGHVVAVELDECIMQPISRLYGF